MDAIQPPFAFLYLLELMLEEGWSAVWMCRCTSRYNKDACLNSRVQILLLFTIQYAEGLFNDKKKFS